MKKDQRSEVRSERRVLCLLPFMFCLLAAQLYAQSSSDAFPSQEIALADWGLTDAAQIAYVRISILHKTAGDTLLLYDYHLLVEAGSLALGLEP